MLRPTSRQDQPAAFGGGRHIYPHELALREVVETWGRARLKNARIVSELVVCRGEARADVVFIEPEHILAVEVKSLQDNMARVLHQAGLFQLCVPEVWIAFDPKHLETAWLVRRLMPTIGLLMVKTTKPGNTRWNTIILPRDDREATEIAQAKRFDPDPEAMLGLLWRDELIAAATAARLYQSKGSKKPSHKTLVDLMLKLDPKERMMAVCRQLRARQAMWRADAPIITH